MNSNFNDPMEITLNGKPHALTPEITTVGSLIEQLGLADRPVVVEHNRTALLPREHGHTPLKHGDVVELVQITAGG